METRLKSPLETRCCCRWAYHLKSMQNDQAFLSYKKEGDPKKASYQNERRISRVIFGRGVLWKLPRNNSDYFWTHKIANRLTDNSEHLLKMYLDLSFFSDVIHNKRVLRWACVLLWQSKRRQEPCGLPAVSSISIWGILVTQINVKSLVINLKIEWI